METGSADNLVKLVTDPSVAGIRERFVKAREAKKHANESFANGREFVEAYVDFTHYLERIHREASSRGEHHGEPGTMRGPEEQERHEHRHG